MRKKVDPWRQPPLITGPWFLSQLNEVHKVNLTVFSCFHCGGGSTMGYKLAGLNVLGGIEVDHEMMGLYRANHHPEEKFSMLMPIQDFRAIQDNMLPEELFNLDILDGSPPCSSFSMAGERDEGWTEKKLFREGQTEQVLDDLFFHFISIADRLKPKVVIAENVKGLVQGKAKGYVRDIFKAFDSAGYTPQLFLLNSASMGVPQSRERVFFIARRKDLNLPLISLNFQEPEIAVRDAIIGCNTDGIKLPPSLLSDWRKIMSGKTKRYFSTSVANPNKPCPTLTSKSTSAAGGVMHWDSPRKFSNSEVARITTFPEDYNFLDQNVGYVCGMSVPPLMMQRVAHEVAKTLLCHRYPPSTDTN